MKFGYLNAAFTAFLRLGKIFGRKSAGVSCRGAVPGFPRRHPRVPAACVVAPLALFAFAALPASGAEIRVPADFSTWTDNGGALVSSNYPGPLAEVEVEISGGADGFALLKAAGKDGGAFLPVAQLYGTATGATFRIAAENGFRRLSVETGNGSSVKSLVATYIDYKLEAPELALTDWTGTSATFSWNAVEGASGYRIDVWTNGIAGASAGSEVWRETFENVESAQIAQKLNSDENFDTEGWSFENVYRCAEEGSVQIGNNKNSGWLQTPALPEVRNAYLRIELRRVNELANPSSISVDLVSGGETNTIGTVQIDHLAASVHYIPAGDISGGTAVIHSIQTGDRRVVIYDFAVVAGYAAGETVRCPVAAETVTSPDGVAATVDGLSGENAYASITAMSPHGDEFASGESNILNIDLAHPPVKIMLSACDNGVYTQSFDSVTVMASGWINMVTLPGWAGYYGADAVVQIRKYLPSAANGGLYSCVTNSYGNGAALGGLPSGEKNLLFGAKFQNDTSSAVYIDRISFEAQQWGFNNSTADGETLVLEYLVADASTDLNAGGDWTEIEDLRFNAEYVKDALPETVPASRTMAKDGLGILVGQGRILHLRWRMPKHSNAALLGIDDFKLEFLSANLRGFHIKLSETGGKDDSVAQEGAAED